MPSDAIPGYAKCLSCGDTLESKHRRDWVECSCGAIAIDGGRDYLKVSTFKAEVKYQLWNGREWFDAE